MGRMTIQAPANTAVNPQALWTTGCARFVAAWRWWRGTWNILYGILYPLTHMRLAQQLIDGEFPRPEVIVRHTGGSKGLGVFAARAFAKGDCVEAAPVVRTIALHSSLPTELRQRVFGWPAYRDQPEGCAMALGYGSLYNSANPANMRYFPFPEAPALLFVAARDIATNEELTINYDARGGGPVWHDRNWFDRHRIQPL